MYAWHMHTYVPLPCLILCVSIAYVTKPYDIQVHLCGAIFLFMIQAITMNSAAQSAL